MVQWSALFLQGRPLDRMYKMLKAIIFTTVFTALLAGCNVPLVPGI